MVRCLAWEQSSFWAWEKRRLAFLLTMIVTWLMAWELASSHALGQTAVAETGGEHATSSEAAALNPPTGLDLKSLERLTKQTLAKVVPAVVSVSGGSGVVVSEDGYVLTVAHVGMRAGRRVWITFPDGKRVRGKTLGNDDGVDAGLLKLDGDGPFPYVKMGHSKDIQPGQWCLALGYPMSFDHGMAPALRVGRVLRNRSNMLVTDCTIMGGDSGGPLFDLDGNVIAISSRCDDRLTVNIHVPVDCFHNDWSRLSKGEDFNSLAAAFLGVGRDEAVDSVKIGEVFGNSGAAAAGVLVGDEILKFDGQALSRYDELPPLIEKHKVGDVVELEIRRGDQVLKLKAKLGERPD